MSIEARGVQATARLIFLCGFLKYARFLWRHSFSINTNTWSKPMANEHFLRGMATGNYFADDLIAARD
ncbi:hypothetical protein ABID21_002533 [Pseudorhizobium tarimense]|uniref:Uncharacterized protein n=1 Tax=Pseudorhizobium tarimense TaxID=1079109 RepID=A0ABV2H7A7_9HYPH|nr:hypothetical protein [Pseudorhizobium tarimense]MCJ8519733.1 hypothetical protein [Pseudorhizobium tarimense]